MAYAAGVEGIVCSLGYVIYTTDVGIDLLHSVFRLMRGLIHIKDVGFSSLEVFCVLVILTVLEEDSRSVGECQFLLGVIVFGESLLRV